MPFGELFPFRGLARKIYDGSSTGVTTTHGVQVRSDYAAQYPELVVAFLKATLEADRLYREKPEELSEKLATWTGVDAEVYYAFHGPHGIQTRDFSLKPEYVTAIRKAQDALKVLKKVEHERRPRTHDLFTAPDFVALKRRGLDALLSATTRRARMSERIPATGPATAAALASNFSELARADASRPLPSASPRRATWMDKFPF